MAHLKPKTQVSPIEYRVDELATAIINAHQSDYKEIIYSSENKRVINDICLQAKKEKEKGAPNPDLPLYGHIIGYVLRHGVCKIDCTRGVFSQDDEPCNKDTVTLLPYVVNLHLNINVGDMTPGNIFAPMRYWPDIKSYWPDFLSKFEHHSAPTKGLLKALNGLRHQNFILNMEWLATGYTEPPETGGYLADLDLVKELVGIDSVAVEIVAKDTDDFTDVHEKLLAKCRDILTASLGKCEVKSVGDKGKKMIFCPAQYSLSNRKDAGFLARFKK